jgi:hypothetical protein
MMVKAGDADTVFEGAVRKGIEVLVRDAGVVSKKQQRNFGIRVSVALRTKPCVASGPHKGRLHAPIGRQSLRADSRHRRETGFPSEYLENANVVRVDLL